MWVTSHELLMSPTSNVLQPQLALLRQEKGQEIHLEEQVAELVEELLVVLGERGVGDLVGLLDRVRHDRPRRLLAIPRALAA